MPRIHRKVWLYWGRWWAVQVQWQPTISVGVRVEYDRPLLDLYFGPLTVAVGNHPVLTRESSRTADSCRGFLFADQEIL